MIQDRLHVQGQRYRWQLQFAQSDEAALRLAASLSLSYPVMQVLAGRGYSTEEEIESFLFTPARAHVYTAGAFKDIERAVSRINHAIKTKEHILIVGDYDVDGLTSTSLMLEALLALGASVNFFIPNRFTDGYGISSKIVEKAYEHGYKLIITVDNGITAIDAAERAKSLGLDLIITDHHTPHEIIPDAYAIVNPRQNDCAYQCKDLAGVGVAYKVISLLYETHERSIPERAYELLLLGTIADVVPLMGENRSLVRYGLARLREQQSLAVSVLKANARIDRLITSQDVGFFLAPQLNALGRLEDPRDGVLFLLGDELQEVERIGRRLYELNQLRKEKERVVFDEVRKKIFAREIVLDRDYAIISVGKNWPAGVIGLTAGKLAQMYGRPTFLLHESGDLYKGSCRSVAGINVFELLTAVAREIPVQFGGHSAAAGLSVKKEFFPQFVAAVQGYLQEITSLEELVPMVTCSAELHLDEITGKLARDLALLEPFGAANDRPVFYLKGLQIVGEVRCIKEEHIKCMVADRGVLKPVIFFNRPELYDWLCSNQDQLFDLAAYVQENEYRGRKTIDLQGVDICLQEENR